MNQRRSDSALLRFHARIKFDGRRKSKSAEKIAFFLFLLLLRGKFRRHDWVYTLCKLFWLVFFLAIAFGASSVDACSPCGDDSFSDVSPRSASFCFPSAPMDFDSQEGDTCKEPCFGARASEMSLQWKPGNVAAFKLADGGIVSCRLVDSEAGFEAGAHSNVDDVGSCVASLVPDVWMKESSEMHVELDEDADTDDLSLINGSSSGNVEITPPFLNWGEKSLYTPSIAILTVKNTNVSGVLDVYEPYSSDPQYYAYRFQKLALASGESASIEFVFLPRRLGFSSARLNLQTSFGGFIIQARGVAVESPYKIEPLVGTMSTNVSPCKMLSRNLSLYNPFEEVLHLKDVNSWVFLPGHKDQAVHIFCRMDQLPHQSSNESGYFLTEDEWFRVDSRKLGVRWLDVRPQNKWQVSPHMTQPILEMRFLPLKAEKIIGAVCLNLQSLAHERLDTPVLPLELDVHHKTNYNNVNNSVSLDIEPLESCKTRETVLIISLRNDGSDLLSLTKISEVTDSPRLFKVRYKEGLLLFPRTSTKIALVKYYGRHLISQNVVADLPREGMKCQLLIGTNHSVSPMIKIPCLDLVHVYSNIEHGSGILASDGFYITGLSQDVGGKYANGSTSLKSLADSSFPMKRFVDEFEAEEKILRNWKSQGTVANASVLEGNELSFPVVPVGSHFSKWISVHNPSWRPIVMQVLLNSWVFVNECKSSDELSELTFLSRFSEIDFPKTRIGFSIPDSAITEALVHPSESALFGPIFFHPSNRCMWRTSALIRNNLSGVEWLPIRAFGGSHLLILLEGSEPVWKLEFDFHLLVNMSSELSSSHIRNNSLCSHLLSKEIYAKNIGELPLVVKKLKVSGTDCHLDGFLVHECHGFTLEPGESKRMLLSYEPDFSTEIVHRDLELQLATGIFVTPMKASLPVNMLNLCRKNFFYRVRREVCLLVFAAVSMFILLLIRISRPSFSMDAEEHYIQVEKKINPRSKTNKTFSRDSAKVSRSTKEDENRHAEFFNEYRIDENLVPDNTNKMQEKQDSDLQKEIAASASKLTKQIDIFDKYSMLGAPQSDSLAIRIKEKGRRRRRKSNGCAGLQVKQEVSSSQSGNSTPSSPLSSNASTPKQAWPLSPETSDTPFAGGLSSELEHQRIHAAEGTAVAGIPEAEKHSQNTQIIPSQRQQHPAPKSTGKQSPASPATPYVRAPGPDSSRKRTLKVAKNDGVGEQYSYDIWGNHFYNNFFVRPKEMNSKMHDTSEGDHQSFFAIDPQSLMMMPSAWSVSPGQQLPSDNVTHLDQMN